MRIAVVTLLIALVPSFGPATRAATPLVFTPYELAGPDGTTIAAQIAWLQVPERRGKSETNRLELAVVRLAARSASPDAPVVYLTGGPGGSAIADAQIPHMALLFERLRERRDVILMDQRGTGMSKPRVAWRASESLPPDVFESEERAIAALRARSELAIAELRARGIDLAGYTSVESADDVDALRSALGVDRIAIVGFSYGTHLALATIRRHPTHVDAVALVGTEGPNHTLKLPSTYDAQLEKLSRLAAEDPGVGRKVPDMAALFRRLLARLDREPIAVDVVDRRSKRPVRLRVGKFGLQVIVRMDIGDGNDIPALPALLYSIERGDTSLLAKLVERRYNQFGAGLSGMAAVMNLASGATAERLTRIDREVQGSPFGNAVNFPDTGYADVWRAPDLGDAYRSPILADTRTLFVSGTLDSNTPPYQAEEVRWGFGRSTHVVVEHAGHEDMLASEAVRRAIVDFLAGNEIRETRVWLPKPAFVPIP